jgi:hypothetical protein
MSAHLSEDQICRCVTGEATREQRKHLEVCADCASKVARTHSALLSFGEVARGFAAAPVLENQAHMAGTARSRAPIAGRWIPVLNATVLSATFVVLLAIAGLTYSLRSRVPERLPARAIDDAVLLNQIRDDVGRSAPHSLAPLDSLAPLALASVLDPGSQRGNE